MKWDLYASSVFSHWSFSGGPCLQVFHRKLEVVGSLFLWSAIGKQFIPPATTINLFLAGNRMQHMLMAFDMLGLKRSFSWISTQISTWILEIFARKEESIGELRRHFRPTDRMLDAVTSSWLPLINVCSEKSLPENLNSVTKELVWSVSLCRDLYWPYAKFQVNTSDVLNWKIHYRKHCDVKRSFQLPHFSCMLHIQEESQNHIET